MMVALLRLLWTLVDIYTWIIIIYCLLTWIPTSGIGVIADVKRVFATLVEPFLKPFQKLIPPIGGMVDITPIIAMLVLQLIKRLIIGL